MAKTIDSVQRQSLPPEELIVVDDGSTDRSGQIARSHGAKVLRNERNLGRGATRARAITECRNDLVLGCDATVVLPQNFVELAIPYFVQPRVAAVFGHFVEKNSSKAVQRWRARHLYKQDLPRATSRRASLVTAAAVQRRRYIMAVGNYRPWLRHSEDGELGERLLAAGHDVISDPRLEFESVQKDSLGGLLERYWRWYAGPFERVSLGSYARGIRYSLRVMIRRDLQHGDVTSALISLLMPHNQYWRSIARDWTKRGNPAIASPPNANTDPTRA